MGLSLKEKTFQKVYAKYPEAKSTAQSSLPFVMHGRIPLCRGYKKPVTFEQIEAQVEALMKRKFEFTLYVCPKDNKALADWDQELAEWRTKNPNSVLCKISDHQIQNIDTWRKTPEWKHAFEAFNKLRNGEKKDFFDGLLQKDKELFCKNHPDVDPADAEGHLLIEVVDIISWMQSEELKAEKLQVSVLLYGFPINQIMYNTITNAHNMGYVADTIIHAKPEYEKKMLEEVQQKGTEVQAEMSNQEEEPSDLDPENEYKKRLYEIFELATIAAHNNKVYTQAAAELFVHVQTVLQNQLFIKPINGNRTSQSNSPTESSKNHVLHPQTNTVLRSRSPSPDGYLKQQRSPVQNKDERPRVNGGTYSFLQGAFASEGKSQGCLLQSPPLAPIPSLPIASTGNQMQHDNAAKGLTRLVGNSLFDSGSLEGSSEGKKICIPEQQPVSTPSSQLCMSKGGSF